MNDVIMCNGLHSHKILTQLKTCERFLTDYYVKFTPEPLHNLCIKISVQTADISQTHFLI